MRVADRTGITLHGEIVDSIAPGSIICSDGWAAYQSIMPSGNHPGLRTATVGPLLYKDHHVVIHDRQFVEPPKHEPPLWRDDILPECRDKTFVGPLPGPLHLGTFLPYRIHTQSIERQRLSLRNAVVSSESLESVDFYIGTTIYKHFWSFLIVVYHHS